MLERAILVFLALAFGVTVFARSVDPNAFNYDVAYILYVAEQMLEGQTLYRDVIDENPPMVFWLSALVVSIARAVGATPILAYNAIVLLLAGLAGALSHRILRLGWPEANPSYRRAVVFCFVAVAVLNPGYDYGQRENLFFIMLAPYIFAAASTARGQSSTRRVALAVGLLAGVGFAIKPYFALVWLAIEFWLHRGHSADRAWARFENRAVVGVQLLYLAAAVVFARAYLDVAEMAWTVYPTYGAFGSPLLLIKWAVGQVLLAAGLCWLVRATAVDRELRSAWLVAAGALLAVALLQGKGWTYHYYPAGAGAILLMAIVGLGLVERKDALAGLIRPGVAVLPLLAMGLLGVYAAIVMGRASLAAWGPGSPQRTVVTDLARVVNESGFQQPIYLMSSSVVPAFPLVNLTGVQWSSRFCCLWMLPGLYSDEERATEPFPYHKREEMSELERYVIDSVISDLEAAPPGLLIVDQSPYKQAFRNTAFEYLNYFRRDPRFAALFREYRPLTSVGPYRVYRKGGSLRSR